MTLTTSPGQSHARAAARFDALAPLRLPPALRLTPEQFGLVWLKGKRQLEGV